VTLSGVSSKGKSSVMIRTTVRRCASFCLSVQKDVLSMVQTFRNRSGIPLPSEWFVENFKSLGRASLPLRGLTVLTGVNSAGKSSLIQSLLLSAQSLGGEITLNGPLARLGEANDVIRSGSDGITVLSYSIDEADGKESHLWEFRIELTADKSSLRVSRFLILKDSLPVLSATTSRVTAELRSEVNPNQEFGDTLLRVQTINGKAAPARTYLSFFGLLPGSIVARKTRVSLLSDIHSTIKKRDNDYGEKMYSLARELRLWGREHPEGLSEEELDLVSRLSPRSLKTLTAAKSEVFGEVLAKFSDGVAAAGWQLVGRAFSSYSPLKNVEVFSSLTGLPSRLEPALEGLVVGESGLIALDRAIRYLGPLRAEPKVVSLTGERNPLLPVGARGESTADLLELQKNKVVTYWDWNHKLHSKKLIDAVSDWANYLGVGNKVNVKDQGILGRGLRLQVQGHERNLTAIGVGASQLLPVLAIVLSADPGNIVCIEQPELHLHPEVQSKLGDFLLFARTDISVIVETHSEYLVTRIRRRVAENDKPPAEVAVYFAEQTDGVTKFRKLNLNVYGDFDEWPKGFFDTQDEDGRAIVKAIAMQRSALK